MKLVYKPLGAVLSILGGVMASFLFTRLWKSITGDDEAPKATQEHRSWGDVLTAAAVQGAIFGLVKRRIRVPC